MESDETEHSLRVNIHTRSNCFLSFKWAMLALFFFSYFVSTVTSDVSHNKSVFLCKSRWSLGYKEESQLVIVNSMIVWSPAV